VTTPLMQPDSGGVQIPAADGYQYADDHPWGAQDQAELTDALWAAVGSLRDEPESVPVFTRQTPSEA
jgi:hypothetical protein